MADGDGALSALDSHGTGRLASPPAFPPQSPPSENNTTALDISLVAAVLLTALLLQQALKSFPCMQRVLTGSGACMLIGCVFNAALLVLSRWNILDGQLSISNPDNEITHSVIYFGLLPPIIFEAGFTCRKRQFFANFGTILSFAVLGTLISLITTGLLVYAFAHDGGIETRFTPSQSMAFGALIASTDPVATLGILKSVKAVPLLNDLIFGESALNDALSIVFFHVFLRAAERADGAGGGGSKPKPWWIRSPPPPPPAPHQETMQLLPVLGDVVHTILGSIGLGIFFACLSAVVTKRLRAAPKIRRPAPSMELALLLLFALLTFSYSERAGFSGVMALFFGAVAMRHYTYYNMSAASQASVSVLVGTMSEAAETCLAVLLGVAFVDYLVKAVDATGPMPFDYDMLAAQDGERDFSAHPRPPVIWDLGFLSLAMPIILLSRALNIFPLSFLMNRCRRPEQRISGRMQVVMWFSGMRGAVSFALAITLPGGGGGHGAMPDSAWTVPIVTTTLGVILFTNLVMAPLTGPIIRALDLQADERRASTSANMPPPHSESTLPTLHDSRHSGTSTSTGPSRLLSASLLPDPGGDDAGVPCSWTPRDSQLQQNNLPGQQGASKPRVSVHRFWKTVDDLYLKPVLGGRYAAQSSARTAGSHEAQGAGAMDETSDE